MNEWGSFDKITNAKGVWLIDSKGNKMIDGVASMWCNVWGHSNPQLVKAITTQSKKLQHSSMFNLTNEPAEQLASKLTKISPGMYKVFYSDNGSSAMEIAIKIALQYWKNIGEKKKTEVLSLGANHAINSTNSDEIAAAAGKFDYIISTVNVKLDWNNYLQTLKPKGRLHFVGATLEPLDISAMSLIMGQRSISGSPVGSPANIARMLEFSVRHNIKPVVENYRFDQVNEAMEKLRNGDVRYRVVLSW